MVSGTKEGSSHTLQLIHNWRPNRKKVKLLSHVRLFATPWTVAHQAPPSMGFPRQEYWSGLAFDKPGISNRKKFPLYYWQREGRISPCPVTAQSMRDCHNAANEKSLYRSSLVAQ